jgi:hypothetical protein
MKRRASRCLGILLLGLLAIVGMAGAQPAGPGLRVSFEAAAVVASGVTPGERVAWFSVAREDTGSGSLIVRREEVTADTDRDGTVRLDLDRPVPPRSIWAAVDLKTGDFALAAPADYPLRQAAFPAGAFRPSAGGGFDRVLAPERELVMLFVARPTVGVWALTVWDGAPEDEDGPANHGISLAFNRMETVAASPGPPATLQPGDLVVLMDPNAMEVSVTRLEGNP